jgi:putative FmdB family regulatory protein
MPYYEYECAKCGKRFEEKQTFAEHEQHQKVKCPHCSSTKVEQLLSAVTVITSKKS